VNEPQEQAILDYLEGKNDTLWLNTSYGTQEEMPVEVFFREAEEMPELELMALDFCEGHILDVGAGVGAHALILQEREQEVTALELSPVCLEVMKKSGVQQIRKGDIFQLEGEKYDTLLFLMNGIGLAGTIDGLKKLLIHLKTLINPGGQVIFDSSNIEYLYNDLPKPTDRYFGQIGYQYEYQGKKGEWFNWLYVDLKTLGEITDETGWTLQVLFEDEYDQYLVRLMLFE
jgi:SAM-dependent methyltransferase